MPRALSKPDPRVKAFCALVNQGIEAWVKAGQLLADIVRDDETAFDKILKNNPHLTDYILRSFLRIGRKEIYPYLLVDGSPGATLLCGLPYDQQITVYHSTVLVAVKTTTGYTKERMKVGDLSFAQAKRVFDLSRIRSFDEQKALFPTQRYIPDRYRDPESHPPTAATASLDEPPEHEVVRLLSTANDSIVEARSALTLLKLTDDAQLDQLLTKSLNSLGQLRFLVNELLQENAHL